MSKVFDRLFFTGPGSLGDAFVMNGIAHYYGDLCQELHIPCYPQYYETIKTLYQDHPHIIVVPILPLDQGENQYVEKHKLSRILRNNLHYIGNTPIAFDHQYYDFYNLPFSLRYKNFRLPKHIDGSDELYEQLGKDEPYVLYHDTTSHYPDGLNIDISTFRRMHNLPPMREIKIDKSLDGGNMLKWVKMIRNASEIHTVSSSFWALVDSMFDQTQAKRFYHDIRPYVIARINNNWNNACWNMVNYPQKISY